MDHIARIQEGGMYRFHVIFHRSLRFGPNPELPETLGGESAGEDRLPGIARNFQILVSSELGVILAPASATSVRRSLDFLIATVLAAGHIGNGTGS